jgi:hypothetical protein
MSDDERGVDELPPTEVTDEPAAMEPATTTEKEAPAQPVTEAAMEPEAEASAEPGETGAPMASPVTELDELAPRKNTGLIVVVASIVIVLLAVVFAGPALYTAVIKKSAPAASTASVSKAKLTVAIGFVKALLNGDTLAIKGFLPPDVQGAITDAQWAQLASQDASAVVQFATPKWSDDTTAVIAIAAQDTTGTLTFGLDAAKPLSVVMHADIAGTTEIDTVVLVQVGSDWRVVSISNGTQTTAFDAKLVKSMVSTATAAPATSTP